MPETHEILIESDLHNAPELKAAITRTIGDNSSGITLEQRKQAALYRMDPTIIVAIITGGATVLAALIQTLIPLLKPSEPLEPKPGTIRFLNSSGGILIDIPGRTPPEQVHEILKVVRISEVVRIVLLHED